MHAIRITEVNRIEMMEVPLPELRPGEVLVKLKTAGLNHRDVWIKKGTYPGVKFPITPGSDGAGIVEACGKGVPENLAGRDVVINPSMDWGHEEKAQGPRFSVVGLPRDGTLAEYVAVPYANAVERPKWMTWQEAAALPVAGLTAWRAVATRARVARGEKVLITGIGGGVAIFALQFARALGAEVWVTSSSDEKIAHAISLGASGGFNYSLPTWLKEAEQAVPHGFDAVIDGAAGPGFDRLLDLASPGGRIALYGATRGVVPDLAPRKVFWKQLSILGSTLGSPHDFQAMINLVQQERIKPVVSEEFRLARAADAFDLMERGDQFGKIVISMP